MHDKIKMLRLGHSQTDNYMNKKYSIDFLSGAVLQKQGERSE